MTVVSDEIIDQSTEELHNLEDDGLKQMVYQMSEEQPNLLGFLLSIGEEELNNEEQEVLLFLGVNVWNAFKKVKPLPQIPDEEIDKADKNNEDMLNYLEKEGEKGLSENAESLVDGHNQAQLLRYVINAIMEEDMEEEEPLVSEENKGLIFLTMKSYIESIDGLNN